MHTHSQEQLSKAVSADFYAIISIGVIVGAKCLGIYPSSFTMCKIFQLSGQISVGKQEITSKSCSDRCKILRVVHFDADQGCVMNDLQVQWLQSWLCLPNTAGPDTAGPHKWQILLNTRTKSSSLDQLIPMQVLQLHLFGGVLQSWKGSPSIGTFTHDIRHTESGRVWTACWCLKQEYLAWSIATVIANVTLWESTHWE